MSALIPKRFKTELARQFHRTITNTINVLTEDRNSVTPLNSTIYVYTATAGQTIFTGSDTNSKTLTYTPGRIEVFKNGVKLSSSAYIAHTGNSIELLSGASNTDDIIIASLNVLTYPNPSDFYHIFLGKTTAWTNDNTAPSPLDIRQDDSLTKRNILAIKRVQPTDTALLIPRIDWTTDTIYIAYSDLNNFHNSEFYVMTSSYRIYKCLYSPGTPSTIEPTQTTAGPFSLSDGYFWQLLYEVPAADRIKFLTTDYIPIQYYGTSTTFDHNGIVDDISVLSGGSGYSSTPTVLILGDGEGATATATLTSGVVTDINVTNSGSGYSFALIQILGGSGSGATAESILRTTDLPVTVNQDVASYAISAGAGIDFIDVLTGGTEYLTASTLVNIVGDGQGATATAVVTQGVVTKINVTDRGAGYTFANITITGAGAGATARAVIEPQGGHGSNIPKELLATTVGITVNIEDILTDFFLNNDFRQLGLIKNVTNFTQSEIYSAATGNGCYVLQVPNLAQYNIDNIILTNSNGKYLVANKTATRVYLLPIVDSISVGSILQNETTGVGSLSITSLTLPEISSKSGDIIYVRNISPVTRQAGQVEQVKLYFSF